jgi:hypothetical protein
VPLEETADIPGQARIHLYAGWALESQERYREALARKRNRGWVMPNCRSSTVI